jgi:hypothetical protein
MRRARPCLLVALVLAALVVAFDYSSVALWDGRYSVDVEVKRTSDRPLVRAEAVTLFREEWDAAEGDPDRIELWEPVTFRDDGSFTIHVPCSGRDSALGRRLSYSRMEVLALKVTYADGSSRLVAVDIPENRSPRKKQIQVP